MEVLSWAAVQVSNPPLAEMVRCVVSRRSRPYAPVSKFRVTALITVAEHPNVPAGTALRFTGCNVENAMLVVAHAEPAAITRMVDDLGGTPKPAIDSVVVALVAEGDHHAVPCGFCRQWIYEFGTEATRIYGVRLTADGDIRDIEFTTLGELLPFAFRLYD